MRNRFLNKVTFLTSVDSDVSYVALPAQESLGAGLALVGQISSVSPRVSVEFASVAKALVAHGAGVRPLARVPTQMRHVAFVAHEALVAVVAAEGEVAGVTARVAHQLVAISKGLLAVLARVAFVVALVDA